MTKFDKVIPPGSEGKVFAAVDISHVNGAIEKYVNITTNDPERNQARLSIKALIKPVVLITPEEQVQFMAGKGESQTKEMTLTPAYEKPITLTSATSDSNVLDVHLDQASGKSSYNLKVTLKPDAPIGNTNATIHIKAEGGPAPEITVPVFAIVRGPISVNPPQVAFILQDYPEQVVPTALVNVRQEPNPNATILGKVKAGTDLQIVTKQGEWYQVVTPKPLKPEVPNSTVGWVKTTGVRPTRMHEPPGSQTVSLQKTSGGNFKVLDYSTAMSQIKVEMQPNAAQGKNYTFKLSLLPPGLNSKGNITGQLMVKTDDPVQPEVVIPVYIIVS